MPNVTPNATRMPRMGAVLTWFGTVLGAFGVLLTLLFVPATWASHHHAIYIFLVAVVAVCLVIAVIAPLGSVVGWVRFRWMVWRAAIKYRKCPQNFEEGRVSFPHSATARRSFHFFTNAHQRRLMETPARPAGLRISYPVEDSIWDVPYSVRRYGKMIFRVEQFLPNGFVIGAQSPGLLVKGEVSYSDLPEPRDVPPRAAESPGSSQAAEEER